MIALNENRRAGMLLCGLGLLFSTLGFLLFDSALLSIGNILFLASFPLLVGMSQAVYLFNPLARPERWRGIVAFWLGVVLVFMKWPLFGIILELGGVVEMFGRFFPRIIAILRAMPYIGTALDLPGIRTVVDWIAGATSARRSAV